MYAEVIDSDLNV